MKPSKAKSVDTFAVFNSRADSKHRLRQDGSEQATRFIKPDLGRTRPLAIDFARLPGYSP
jgi:hypothetical protein